MGALAEENLDAENGNSKWLVAAGWLLATAALVALVFMLMNLGGGSAGPQRQVTRITVLPDTPPPPPPPKEEPKAPRETKDVKMEQPKPVELPQEAQQLKMEGQAGEGASPFASGSVTRDYIGGPIGAGKGGGMQYAFFSNALQRHIQEELARNRKIKVGDYRVTVTVWLAGDGSIRRANLVTSSGSDSTDEALRKALSEIGPIRTAVPESLPQPIKLRISNRLTG